MGPRERAKEPSERPIRVFMIACEWPRRGCPIKSGLSSEQFLRRAGVEIDLFAFRGAKNPYVPSRLDRFAAKNFCDKPLCHDLIHAQWGQSGFLATPRRFRTGR